MAAPIKTCFYVTNGNYFRTKRIARIWGHFILRPHSVRVRFAPSPTGMLHLGGLRTALYNYLFAKSQKGTFILRIEDTDQTRLVPGAMDKLEGILSWTGLVPDEGPRQGGSYGPYIQSQRLAIYQENIQKLLQNKTAYPCFCTPKRLELLRRDAVRRGETPKYDNRCRHLTSDEVTERLEKKLLHVVRFKLEHTTDTWEDLVKGPSSHDVANIEGDPVLMKSDGFPTYHFANVVDDHLMKVTHVLRGDEWQPSTMKHILLYRAFDWSPPHFAHLPLIVNKDGTKLSKRQGDLHVENIKNRGYFPEAVLNLVTKIGGGFDMDGTNGMGLDELTQKFSIEKVKSSHGRLDMQTLDDANLEHLRIKVNGAERSLIIDQLRELVSTAYSERLGDASITDHILSSQYIGSILDWAVSEKRIIKTNDLLDSKFSFLWTTPQEQDIADLKNSPVSVPDLLHGCITTLDTVRDFDIGHVTQSLRSLIKDEKLKMNTCMHCLRKSLSGLQQGPPVAEMMTIIGKKNTIQRLKHTMDVLTKS
ncbi:probable glutamate--tRNA ligase, mitochondrial [Gigantopelta aegis]|uniref:probable glutamate--tRNA ligase, mitochondrial n=1 Tax=Gigantopelta aegis TaxID=1735272 RepID=UPI001B88A304|nr:probable glutamate--tRNA ligase, mitochondrial [Gigantopelta aegis]